MSTITVTLPDDVCDALQDEYKQMSMAWPRPGRTSLPPSFEEWLGTRLAESTPDVKTAKQDMLLFTAIEKLITQLQPHGFGLAHLGKNSLPLSHATRELSMHLVEHLELPETQLKRLEDLIGYYARNAKEVADLAHVGITNRTYGALHEVCRELVQRTADAADRLGEERAIGRAEGAIAMLVSLGVMDRTVGKEKTEEFKEQVRHPRRA